MPRGHREELLESKIWTAVSETLISDIYLGAAASLTTGACQEFSGFLPSHIAVCPRGIPEAFTHGTFVCLLHEKWTRLKLKMRSAGVFADFKTRVDVQLLDWARNVLPVECMEIAKATFMDEFERIVRVW